MLDKQERGDGQQDGRGNRTHREGSGKGEHFFRVLEKSLTIETIASACTDRLLREKAGEKGRKNSLSEERKTAHMRVLQHKSVQRG